MQHSRVKNFKWDIPVVTSSPVCGGYSHSTESFTEYSLSKQSYGLNHNFIFNLTSRWHVTDYAFRNLPPCSDSREIFVITSQWLQIECTSRSIVNNLTIGCCPLPSMSLQQNHSLNLIQEERLLSCPKPTGSPLWKWKI